MSLFLFSDVSCANGVIAELSKFLSREKFKKQEDRLQQVVQLLLVQKLALSGQVLLTPVSGFCLLPGDVFVA